jgi:flagellar biosynthetic protein FlhB
MEMGVGEILFFIGRVSFSICFYTSLALIVLAALDYAFQRFQYEESLKMSKQELKDELKQREGDPLVKARIRRTQIEMARRRMMEAVPEADVVITNPNSLAVALKYDAEKMIAPRVIAKGAGFIAERIKEIAKDKGIPVIENKPLAQTLFKVVEIGEFIPVNLYRAVAEILAYVYRLKGVKSKV